MITQLASRNLATTRWFKLLLVVNVVKDWLKMIDVSSLSDIPEMNDWLLVCSD